MFFLSEFTREHGYYLIYIFAIILILAWGFIGSNETQKNSIVFYVGLLGIPSLIFMIADWVIR